MIEGSKRQGISYFTFCKIGIIKAEFTVLRNGFIHNRAYSVVNQ